ncbi:MAG: SDR family NAD(P)-dependent oxidoreductase [Salibacteraceae bacterium]
MNLELKNKVVLITGGTGGIGSRVVADYLLEGVVVACFIRSEVKMQSLLDLLNKEGISTDNLHAFNCNLLDYEDVKRATKEVVSKLNAIHILINCAGFADEYPFAMLDVKKIDLMLDLNLKSPIYLSQAVLKTMYKQKEGCIINVSSVSSIKKGRGITVYAAAKAGLENFTRTLAIELGRKNIRVNCIRPGVISTTMSGPLLDRTKDILKTNTALERAGEPSEISSAILFMSSNKTASYMTGETITVDGGVY